MIQCKKCGQENLDGAQLCQKCGSRLNVPGQQPLVRPALAASRITGLFVLAAGVLVLVGIFLSWLTFEWSAGEWFGKISASVSGWDLVTGGGENNGDTEAYAIFAFIGSIVVLIGGVWALAMPDNRGAWAVATLGGVLAVVGCAWGWSDLHDYVEAGSTIVGASYDYGVGLYMATAGAIVGLIGGFYGILRSSAPSV